MRNMSARYLIYELIVWVGQAKETHILVKFGHGNSSVIDLFHLGSNNDDKKDSISLHLPTLFARQELVRECVEVMIVSKVINRSAFALIRNQLY